VLALDANYDYSTSLTLSHYYPTFYTGLGLLYYWLYVVKYRATLAASKCGSLWRVVFLHRNKFSRRNSGGKFISSICTMSYVEKIPITAMSTKHHTTLLSLIINYTKALIAIYYYILCRRSKNL